jgi:ligand-binding sensor domain-containing protein
MDKRGILWIGTREGIYYIKRDDGLVHHVRGTSYMPINAFLNKASEKLWIGTMVGGVKEMNLTDLNRKSITNNLPDDFIQCMIEDNAGNIWLGTDVGGLVQLSIRRIRKLMDVKIFSDVAVSALHQDRNESILVGTRNKGLFQIRDNNIVSVLTTSR